MWHCSVASLGGGKCERRCERRLARRFTLITNVFLQNKNPPTMQQAQHFRARYVSTLCQHVVSARYVSTLITKGQQHLLWPENNVPSRTRRLSKTFLANYIFGKSTVLSTFLSVWVFTCLKIKILILNLFKAFAAAIWRLRTLALYLTT